MPLPTRIEHKMNTITIGVDTVIYNSFYGSSKPVRTFGKTGDVYSITMGYISGIKMVGKEGQIVDYNIYTACSTVIYCQ